MKIALLGTGFGQAYAAVYTPRSDVEVVTFGRNPAKTAKVADQFGFASSTEMDHAFADDSVDLVDICLPIGLHAEYVLRTPQAGKHALVELPLADNLADARRVAGPQNAATETCSWTCSNGSSRPTRRCSTRSATAPTGGWSSSRCRT
jgi:predicted dehydrogenase